MKFLIGKPLLAIFFCTSLLIALSPIAAGSNQLSEKQRDHATTNQAGHIYDIQNNGIFLGSKQTQFANRKQQFPDKIIQSRKTHGRFLLKEWGDYLYVTVSTKSGEKVFLIDSNEDCFIIQHRTEQIAINYDIIDRYTPEMGGYRRVNVIRNITSRKTNLKKWRRTVTKKELDQCEGVQQ